MMPIFINHTLLDGYSELCSGLLPEQAANGQKRLQKLRDLAIEEGASVLLVIWPTCDWVLLAVEVPPDVTITDPAQLIPNLMANPEALEQMLQCAQQGKRLVWLHLNRPAALH